MEWTWLKDWWRLKKLRSRHQRHKKKLEAAAAAAASAAVSTAAVLPGSEPVAGGEDRRASRRHSLEAIPGGESGHAQRRGRVRDRLRRNRLLECQRRSHSAGVHARQLDKGAAAADAEDDGEYGPFNVSDYEDYGPSHGSDGESDDFCYCDICLNVGLMGLPHNSPTYRLPVTGYPISVCQTKRR
ncbi:Hypothetical predicted protein [Drosophila guanche]|uniref:Uncharacterized protein n=1 Tax=Drosophila guanche TaxID=7266 RepID=A0A3B0JWW7_DROGU|nr:Hypothetical predicted protein [Drosophila guanche]